MQVQLLGIAWYREADYPEILEVMVDAHVLPASHGEWQKLAESLERERQRHGMRVVRAVIDPKTFAPWCRQRGLDVDAKARMAFANAEACRVARG